MGIRLGWSAWTPFLLMGVSRVRPSFAHGWVSLLLLAEWLHVSTQGSGKSCNFHTCSHWNQRPCDFHGPEYSNCEIRVESSATNQKFYPYSNPMPLQISAQTWTNYPNRSIFKIVFITQNVSGGILVINGQLPVLWEGAMIFISWFSFSLTGSTRTKIWLWFNIAVSI